MRLRQVPLKSIEREESVIRATTPFVLEYSEVAHLVKDFFEVYKEKINPRVQSLGELVREQNADTYPLNSEFGMQNAEFHIIYDIEETHFVFELPNSEDALKLFRLLREQKTILVDLEHIRNNVHGSLSEIVAAILWQIGAIKVSLGDLRPYFKVDERKNLSPIYIDLKGLPNYPTVQDFLVSQAALLLRNQNFDAICGIEAGSIAFAALLAKKLTKPMFFARRERRYSEASLLEGIKSHEIFRKKILIVDDTLVKGWTKARVIQEIRKADGIVGSCFVIFDRMQGGKEYLERELGVQLFSLTNRDAALSRNISRDITFLTDNEENEVIEYFDNPKLWHERRGFSYHEIKPH